jgi:hypothetical protein
VLGLGLLWISAPAEENEKVASIRSKMMALTMLFGCLGLQFASPPQENFWREMLMVVAGGGSLSRSVSVEQRGEPCPQSNHDISPLNHNNIAPITTQSGR